MKLREYLAQVEAREWKRHKRDRMRGELWRRITYRRLPRFTRDAAKRAAWSSFEVGTLGWYAGKGGTR